ncbi:uncharacterized protein [Ptychodera flava]|uniref:uncharacterized protein n=1 Tax=Ptychodera flava TaxID=63121 RepID=UPI003969E2C7
MNRNHFIFSFTLKMDDDMTYDTISMWRVDALKSFLRKRNLKVSGRKVELVARVFAAAEQNIPVAKTASEIATEIDKSVQSLLSLPESDSVVPDPMKLNDGWIGETEGMKQWPPIFLSDITMFIMADHPGNDINLQKRLLNEYKEGKAYRLYQGGWLKEIYFHNITEESQYCFLKARCCHTMKLNDVPHTVWICANKQSGDIKSAYCSCTAGLGSSCIHITAMFFRIEAAVRTGQTNFSCTAKLCQWNIPRGRTKIDPIRVCDMEFKAAKFNKDVTKPLVDVRRKLFEPIKESHRESDDVKRRRLFSGLQTVVPGGCYEAMYDKKLKSFESDEVIVENVAIDEPDCTLLVDPLPPHENIILKLADSSTTKEELLSKIEETKFTDYDVSSIENKTIGQAENNLWKEQRKGRITASTFYSVYTKVNTVKSEKHFNINSFARSFIECSPWLEKIPAIKHGRTLEVEAKKKYVGIMKTHVNFNYRECGFFIDKQKPYLGASPDLIVGCECCGTGLLECKCPYSIRHECPSEFNVNYLIADAQGDVQMKKNHQYYAQIQGQMAIVGAKWCDLMIYTYAGYYLKRIDFDQNYWFDILLNLEFFFRTYLAEKLISVKTGD